MLSKSYRLHKDSSDHELDSATDNRIKIANTIEAVLLNALAWIMRTILQVASTSFVSKNQWEDVTVEIELPEDAYRKKTTSERVLKQLTFSLIHDKYIPWQTYHPYGCLKKLKLRLRLDIEFPNQPETRA